MSDKLVNLSEPESGVSLDMPLLEGTEGPGVFAIYDELNVEVEPNLGDFMLLVVFGRGADIEGLIMNQVSGRLQGGDVGERDVRHVDHRAPGGAVALEIDQPLGEGPGGEVVDHEVEANSRR